MVEKSLRKGFFVTITVLLLIACYIMLFKRAIYDFTVIFTFVLALAFILILMSIFKYIIEKAGTKEYDWRGIICESDGHPSLSRAQFLTWISVIGIVFVWFLLIKISIFLPGTALHNLMIKENINADISKLEDFGISLNLFYLMGLTSFTAIAGKGLSSIKYKGKKTKEGQKPLNPWTMFLENNRPSATRYQMFVWTSIGVLTFLGFALSSVLNNGNSIESILNMKLPNCPDALLVLMGISQVTYLSGKLTLQPPDVFITGIFSGNAPKNKDKITILGYGFENEPGTVLIDETIIDELDIPKSQWSNTKITLPMPNGMSRFEVRVVTHTFGKVSDPYLYENCTNTVDKNYDNTTNEKQEVKEGIVGNPAD